MDCSDATIAPAGQSAYRKEVPFRISSAEAWNPADDWSYPSSATTPGTTAVDAPNTVLMEGSAKQWAGPCLTVNATISQSGADVTATNVAHNAAIPAGGTVSFGFQGSSAPAARPRAAH